MYLFVYFNMYINLKCVYVYKKKLYFEFKINLFYIIDDIKWDNDCFIFLKGF